MVSLIDAAQAQAEFDLTYELVKPVVGTDFRKSKLEFITHRDYAEREGLLEKFEGSSFSWLRTPRMAYVYRQGVCLVISDYFGLDIERRPLSFAHEHVHSAQFSIPQLYYDKFCDSLTSLDDVFLEGNADAIAVEALSSHEDYFFMTVDEELIINRDLLEAKSDMNDISLANMLDNLDQESMKKFTTIYKYALGYEFSKRNLHVPFERLIRNRPKTFKELLVEGVYQP